MLGYLGLCSIVSRSIPHALTPPRPGPLLYRRARIAIVLLCRAIFRVLGQKTSLLASYVSCNLPGFHLLKLIRFKKYLSGEVLQTSELVLD